MSAFNEFDKNLVRSFLRKLPQDQRTAIVLKFWEDYSLSQIASELEITWDGAAHLIENGIQSLRKYCLSHPEFSLAYSSAS